METTNKLSVAEEWNGGISPFGVTWQKFMMWIFIVSDALLFAGFLAGYGFLRLAAKSWPNQAEVFDLKYVTIMTFVLISSSYTMARAVSSAKHGELKDSIKFILFTLIGGAIFLGMQVYEWYHFISEGAQLNQNPWGVPQFSASFFVITGFHGTHVLIGLIILIITIIRTKLNISTGNGIEYSGLYWHFVDLVWVFIFTLFYLV